MKILIDARESGTTTGRYVDKLIEYLQRIDTKNEYVVLYKSPRLGLKLLTASNFRAERCDIKEFTFAEQLTLLQQFRSIDPDLVFFPMVQQPILYKGKVVTMMQDLTTLRFKNPSKNPVMFTAKQKVYSLVNKVAAKKSVALLTPTEFVKQDVRQFTGVSSEKITVTYEAADTIDTLTEKVSELEGARFIMYVGRPLPHKNLGRLIFAFKKLHEKHPDLKLVLAGKKDALFLQHEQKVGDLGLSDSVIFTDFVSEGQLRWLYENCTAYVFPSLSEGFGLPGLEAMIHGAPVVSSNTTCLPEVYGDAAHYFDPLSIDDMAHKIEEVLTDDVLRLELIKRGYEQVKKYSWQRMAKQTLEVYEKALAK